jgi:integrase
LPARSKIAAVVHHAAVPWRELPALYERIATSSSISSQCLAFAILTASRSGEARGARWNEIDLAACVWAVPPVRMKAGRPHRVPLSDPAMAILRAMQPHQRAADSLVFPGGVVGKPLSDVALNKALAAAGGAAFTVHGLRSTFRDWAAEATGTPREVAEAALAHTNRDKVEAAYLRGDHFDRRRVLMAAWAAHCLREPGANVVLLGARA